MEYTDKLDDDRVSENYRAVAERVRERSGGRCKLLLATKTVSPRQINALAEREYKLLIGENRVQELCDKYPFLDRKRMEIHFIGSLQTNKVRQIIDKVDMIHSVDRLSLAQEIDRRALAMGKHMDVLCEINIGREAEKGGVMPEGADELCLRLLELPGIRLRGLMTMAPKLDEETMYEPYFLETQRIYERIRAQMPSHINFDTLSMGMSDSYGVAAGCGATLVRVGSAVFGKRSAPDPERNRIDSQ